MADGDSADILRTTAGTAQAEFRTVGTLRNHWSRPAGPRAYYWYLTFADAPGLRALAAQCQRSIAFPYYDPVSGAGLHLTLDRIAQEDDITKAQLTAIEAAAGRACKQIPPFAITAGALDGSRGAVGFTVSPARRVHELRDALRAATLSAHPAALVMPNEVAPHVTIAYANTDGVLAAEAVAAVERLNASAARAEAAVGAACLVLLERRQHSYAWQTIARIPLAGPGRQPPGR